MRARAALAVAIALAVPACTPRGTAPRRTEFLTASVAIPEGRIPVYAARRAPSSRAQVVQDVVELVDLITGDRPGSADLDEVRREAATDVSVDLDEETWVLTVDARGHGRHGRGDATRPVILAAFGRWIDALEWRGVIAPGEFDPSLGDVKTIGPVSRTEGLIPMEHHLAVRASPHGHAVWGDELTLTLSAVDHSLVRVELRRVDLEVVDHVDPPHWDLERIVYDARRAKELPLRVLPVVMPARAIRRRGGSR